MAEVTGLVVSVAGLFLAVPVLGGLGASMVSAATYTAVFALLLWFFHRAAGIPVRSCLIPQDGDLEWIRQQWRRRSPVEATPSLVEEIP
jgi:hypothetical protein